ncbi:AraC family transcriptional regulator [Lentisphaera profundi]|uniref:AraC family transcriptional regulator n=1 Tax=Lentisphaera profundi TaxID=1658616 RepID=A0ABY7VZR0_9BACT|nr:AraC family transcriptional regulator [Lentisphaera profundi]WDE99436.1 AraC family transcriptional regulator [Lentisphaera profundi]
MLIIELRISFNLQNKSQIMFMTMSNTEKIQYAKDFLDSAEPFCVSQLFEYMSDTYFFVKDCEGRFIKANKAFLKLFGYDKLEQIIGLTDYDMVSRELAVRYEMDDARIFAGEKVCELSEPVSSEDGVVSMHVSTKLPVKDKDGQIIGLIGITRDSVKTLDALSPLQEFKSVLDIIERDYDKTIKIDDLAKKLCMSSSTFLRHFKKQFGVSPTTYIKQVRHKMVSRLLIESSKSLSEIAYKCGFSDQSHMTREFKRMAGITPKAYRSKFS